MKSFFHRLVLGWFPVMLSMAYPAQAQLPQMSREQAFQILLGYVQTPDTTLSNIPLVSWIDNMTGDPIFQFYGGDHRTGGSYRIDSVSGEKWIRYVRRSTWDKQPDDAPQLLSADQLQQIAATFVQQHFPAYVPGIAVFPPQNPVSVADRDSFRINFGLVAPSGADLLSWCTLYVEEDTGFVYDYNETCLPVTISTAPQITQDQAVAIGQGWIYQNISTNPAQGLLQTNFAPGEPVVEFKVTVDPMLNEALVYNISYMACGLIIDAHTGAVIGEDGYASIGHPMKSGPGKTGVDREIMQTVRYGGSMITEHSAIATRGQVYIWSGFLKSLGIQSQQHSGWLLLSSGSKNLRLRVRSNADAQGKAAWDRKGSLYLPMTQITELTRRVIADPQSGEVQITLPEVPASAPGGGLTIKQ